MQNAGAAAVTIHGRTMEQRYKRAADWGLVQQAADHLTVPVIGNGDVLTYYEVTLLIPCLMPCSEKGSAVHANTLTKMMHASRRVVI